MPAASLLHPEHPIVIGRRPAQGWGVAERIEDEAALEAARWKRALAAQRLGMPLRTLARKITPSTSI